MIIAYGPLVLFGFEQPSFLNFAVDRKTPPASGEKKNDIQDGYRSNDRFFNS